VTYGAGGSTQQGTFDTVGEILAEGVSAASHFSCIGATKASVREQLSTLKAMGVQRLVALRGDLPSGYGASGEFHYASDLVAFIRDVVEQTGVDPSWLTLELTERLIATDSPEMLAIFQRVRELGVGLSIDDFGTEYSSLRYLERFPVTEVKIDRSFVADLHHHTAKRIIVGAVIQLGGELGIDIVAEGIQQEDERAMLRAMNCKLGQGYLFSGPLSEDHFAALARDGILPGSGRV
jgi:hypothetical protein